MRIVKRFADYSSPVNFGGAWFFCGWGMMLLDDLIPRSAA
jgi:hypothetical protein